MPKPAVVQVGFQAQQTGVANEVTATSGQAR